MKSMAERIQEAMGKMTRAEFARAMKVSGASVTFWLDGTTQSLSAETANRMQDVTGYRASWIVTGKGPKKVADQAGPVDELRFSADVRRKVVTLSDEELYWLETILRSVLRLPQQKAPSVTEARQFDTVEHVPGVHHRPQEAEAGAIENEGLPSKRTHEDHVNQRRAHSKGGRGA